MEIVPFAFKNKNIFFIFVLILCALAFRRNDIFLNPQLWAEDGPVFLQQFYEKGIASLITPYAGYLNTIQRLIVLFWGELHVNLIYIPTLYCATIILMLVFVAYRIWLTTVYMGINNRIAYAVFFMFVPVTSDVFMNITNLNGILSLYLINFLFVRNDIAEPRKGALVFNSLILLIISLSGPTSILLCPTVVLIIFIDRKILTPQKLLPLAIILICGIIQLISVKFIDKGFYRGAEGVTENYHLLKFFTYNVGDLMFVQYGFWPEMSHRTTMIVLLAGLIALTGLFVKCFLDVKNKNKFVIILAIVFYVGGVIHAYWPHESYLYALRNASRYFIVPYTCIGWIFILALDKKLKKEHVALYVLFLLLQTKYIKFELQDKKWKDEIGEYKEGKRDIIDINPEGWKFGLPRKK